jgi:hypothetical protein
MTETRFVKKVDSEFIPRRRAAGNRETSKMRTFRAF